MDEQPPPRLRRDDEVEMSLKRLKHLIEIHRACQPCGVGVQLVEVPHASACAGTAYEDRVEAVDD
jgi:hypothetical protein